VLALTADVTPETEARCLAAGMDGCITKPVQPARLLEALAGFAPAAPRPDRIRAAPPPAKTVEEPALDAEALAGLVSLGGEEFLRSLAEDFVAEASDLLQRLQDAAESLDGPAFRREAHALASCAANMGASPLHALCRSAQRLGAEDLAARGHRHAEAVALELARVRVALAPLRSAAPTHG
jgi:two-component system sensor histidine kinase RpfC